MAINVVVFNNYSCLDWHQVSLRCVHTVPGYEHNFALVHTPKSGHSAQARVQGPNLVHRHRIWHWHWHQSAHNLCECPSILSTILCSNCQHDRRVEMVEGEIKCVNRCVYSASSLNGPQNRGTAQALLGHQV